MSEASKCDRCGGLNDGSPHTGLALGDGLSRDGPQDTDVRTSEMRMHYETGEFDLCAGCRNDFRQWWADGGGDPAEVAPDE